MNEAIKLAIEKEFNNLIEEARVGEGWTRDGKAMQERIIEARDGILSTLLN